MSDVLLSLTLILCIATLLLNMHWQPLASGGIGRSTQVNSEVIQEIGELTNYIGLKIQVDKTK
jgi:hypothetical protein